jgi:hypothetical protein
VRAAEHEANPAKVLHFPKRHRSRAENSIEARLRELGNVINDLTDAPYPALLTERERIRVALEQLTIEEATLRWVVRVARTTEGAIQRRLWSSIDKALTDLERIAESIMQPESAAFIAPLRSRRRSCQE